MLRDELASIKAEIQLKTSEYMLKRVEMAREESDRLFKASDIPEAWREEKRRTLPLYQSLEQFMKKQYEISV